MSIFGLTRNCRFKFVLLLIIYLWGIPILYHDPGGRNVTTIGQAEIFKMAFNISAATRNLLFNLIS